MAAIKKRLISEIVGASLIFISSQAVAQNDGFGGTMRFSEQGGEALFKNVCQACHMPDGQGAPGHYPALQRNPKLAVVGYPISVVLNGQKGMPSFGEMMNDQQIADVVRYVRTHFENNFTDKISPADVKALRR